MKKPRIGILGGAGVAAINILLTRLEEHYIQHGAKGDYEQPELILYSATKTPSRSMFLEGKGESFIPDYIRIAKELEYMGATILVMCCNTAHYAIDVIQQAIDIPCINMIEDVCTAIRRSGANEIALLASEGCLQGKVYEKYIDTMCPDVKILYPDSFSQKKITKGIWNTKNIHRFDAIDSPERPRTLFREVIEDLYSQGVRAFVFGCTDICVDFTPPRVYLNLNI